MKEYIPLSELPLGGKCKVMEINLEGNIRRRMLDLGLVNGTIVEAIQKGPFGEPVAYLIRGAVIAIRSEVASMILVKKL